MGINNAQEVKLSNRTETPASLRIEIQTVSKKCINCDLCQKECDFLRQYGKPKEIADSYDPFSPLYPAMAFECSLCQLCAAVCPVKVDPSRMFLEMRREAVRQGVGNFPEHGGILSYERRGTSKRYSWYSLPEGCDSILFPGCTLPGTRPDKTLRLFQYMKQQVPNLGIVLDCCTKPSHDLGREAHFHAMFGEMKGFLIQNDVRNVFVACPNCYKIFKQYGGELSVKTVYEFMAENGFPGKDNIDDTVTIHDPCALRFEEPIQSAVRKLVSRQGLAITEMPHSGKRTLCCGEGGSVGFVSPEISKKWSELRKQETNGTRVMSYCAGCVNLLDTTTPSSHILDLLFEPETTMNGQAKAAKPPLTYINRLKLKRHLKKTLKNSISREREFKTEESSIAGGKATQIILSLLIIGALIIVRITGAHQYLDQEAFRQLVQAYGAFGPVIYMLIYTIAPALFLPGLPITIAGGILFGPLWGVIYTITSATLGACVAFLISRYLARDWIESKLKGSKWRRLDQGVERHGWKVVAFTRLIPLFPFNLLNYAFGLTKIKFSHYATATFVCMLPGCVAYIVFSSSLLEVLRGNISTDFIIGVILVVLVSLIPFIYRRFKERKGLSGPI